MKSSSRVTAILTKFVAVFVSVALLSSTVQAAEPCDPESLEYAPCLEKSLLYKAEQNEILLQRIVVKDEINNALSQDRDRLIKSVSDSQGVLSSPVFWLGVGIIGGIIATVAVGVVVKESWKP